jgi:hypothetical protein
VPGRRGGGGPTSGSAAADAELAEIALRTTAAMIGRAFIT